MEKGLVLTGARYTKLVGDLRRMIDEGRSRAASAANREYMGTYWRVGGRLAAERLTEAAGYGQSVMEKLAIELKTDRSTLVRCLQFHRDYPKGVPEGTPLSWSHFRLLVTVKDAKARAYYEKVAEEKKWTEHQLSRAIQADEYGLVQPTDDGKPLPPSPKKLNRPKGGPFIYRAEVLRVVDGDTIVVRLDLGFDVWKKEIIRFAMVDAPPIKEDGGEQAFDFVKDQLAKAKVLVIDTDKADSHGRYIGHVMYSTNERDEWEKVFASGRYLNQELLDKGLARVY